MTNILKNEYLNRYQKSKFILLRALLLYYRDINYRVVVLIYTAQKTKNKWARRAILKKLLVKYNVTIGCNTNIGKNLKIEHHQGIVIGRDAIIGDNCTLYQQITIGQKNNNFPCIGKNVTIYPGARVIGGINIGDNVIIGANAVVNKNVDKNCIVAGVPAKVIGMVENV